MPEPKKTKPYNYNIVLRNGVTRGTRSLVVLAFSEAQARMAALPGDKESIVTCERIGGFEAAMKGSVWAGKPGTRHLLLFFKDLSTLIRMGTSIIKSLRLEIPIATNSVMRATIAHVIASIEEGKTFPEALRLQGEIFTPAMCALVEAGQKSGEMAVVLKNMATAMSRQYKIFRKLKSAMIYPVIVMLAMLVVIYIFTYDLVPQLAKIYLQFKAKLPFLTQVIIGFSNLMTTYPILAPIPIIMVGLLVFYWGSIYNTPWMQKLCVRIPIIGPIIRKAAMTKSLRTMAMLSSAKVDIRENLKLCAMSVGHVEYEQAFTGILQYVENGESLHEGFVKVAKLFGKDRREVAAFIQSGQEAGTINETINSIADLYEDDLDEMASNIGTLIEPIIFVIMALVVGMLLYAVYSPIFNLSLVIFGNHGH